MSETELVMKQMVRQFMKDQLNNLKQDNQENNNSFVFLEKSTLNMLIIYMLMNGESLPEEEVNGDSQMKILEELEQDIADNKKDFEEIMALLKERI